LLAGVLLSASLAVWYYESSSAGGVLTAAEPEFSVTIGSGSRRRTETFKFKPDAELEAMLHAHENTNEPKRAGNPVARWDTNYVPSNEPCEDRSAADVVERGAGSASWYAKWLGLGGPAFDEEKPGKRDLVMVSVIDGHAGDATSRLLSRTLHPSLTVGLAGLQAGIVPGASWYTKIADTLTRTRTWSPANVSKTLQSA
jgi:pyruvate dehydrogenase phosphatase